MDGVMSGDLGGHRDRSSAPGLDVSAVGAASDEVRAVLDRLLSEVDQIAGRLAVRPPEIEARERELDELEDLRMALLERTEAANERCGAAERLVEQSRGRLVEIAEAQQQAHATLEAANRRAATIIAHAEAKAASLQSQVERKAVERIRRAEREAADRLVEAEFEAQRLVAEAVTALRDAEIKARETIASVQQRVDVLVDEATRARHAEVDQLRAREREVEDRIRALLAESGSLATLPRATPLRDAASTVRAGPGADDVAEVEPVASLATALSSPLGESTIDLTDVSDAISDAIDAWVNRRETH